MALKHAVLLTLALVFASGLALATLLGALPPDLVLALFFGFAAGIAATHWYLGARRLRKRRRQKEQLNREWRKLMKRHGCRRTNKRSEPLA
jgi:Flp pilus assembly protein TadB